MALNALRLEITTPKETRVFENILVCSAPGVEGGFQILFNHAPLMSQLEIGEIKLESTDGLTFFATSGGFLEVLENKVSLLLETCEDASEIDEERAKSAADRARKRLIESNKEIDVERAQLALNRALNRLKVLQHI